MSRYDDDYYGGWRSWPKPLRKDERLARAGRAAKKLSRGGRELHPVVVEGRTAAKSAWGKGWCTTLASYGDYENRLPRGLSYLRSGAVIDLAIQRGRVEALVSGSRVYKVRIDIRPLTRARWSAMKAQCAGGITSLVALLRGELSPPIIDVIARREGGLFPASEEIDVTCSCPDSAVMCKHVAAVLYGIGTRLDAEPELLFVLRGVDHRELITDAPVAAVKRGRRASSPAGKMASAELEAVFGIELDGPSTTEPASDETRPTRKSTKTKRKTPSERPRPARGGGEAKSAGRTGTTKRAAASKPGGTARKAATTASIKQKRNGKR
jgi:uncharacterized Zn finger protein